MALVIYTTFPAIFTFLIGHVATVSEDNVSLIYIVL